MHIVNQILYDTHLIKSRRRRDRRNCTMHLMEVDQDFLTHLRTLYKPAFDRELAYTILTATQEICIIH